MSLKILFILFAIHITLIIGVNCTKQSSKDFQKTASFCEQSKTPLYQEKPKKLHFNATAFAAGLLEAWNFGKLKNFVDNTPDGVVIEREDVIIRLDSNNFDENVYNNSSIAWFVLFNSKHSKSINSMLNSKLWRSLGNSVYNWRKILVLGEVDCDQLSNLPLCYQYDAWENRKIQYFAPFTDASVDPENFNETHCVHPFLIEPDFINDLASWRSLLVLHIEQLTPENKIPAHWPKLASLTTNETVESLLVSNNIVYDPEIWVYNLFQCFLTREKHLSVSDLSLDTNILLNHLDSTWRSNNSRLLILIVEHYESTVGQELILDLYGAPVTVRRVFVSEFFTTEVLPQVFVITSDDTRERVPLWTTNRSGVYFILRSYLRNKGYLLLGNSVECGKYLSLEDLEELAKDVKKHPVTVDQMEIIHCMQEKLIHAMLDAFRSINN